MKQKSHFFFKKQSQRGGTATNGNPAENEDIDSRGNMDPGLNPGAEGILAESKHVQRTVH